MEHFMFNTVPYIFAVGGFAFISVIGYALTKVKPAEKLEPAPAPEDEKVDDLALLLHPIGDCPACPFDGTCKFCPYGVELDPYDPYAIHPGVLHDTFVVVVGSEHLEQAVHRMRELMLLAQQGDRHAKKTLDFMKHYGSLPPDALADPMTEAEAEMIRWMETLKEDR